MRHSFAPLAMIGLVLVCCANHNRNDPSARTTFTAPKQSRGTSVTPPLQHLKASQVEADDSMEQPATDAGRVNSTEPLAESVATSFDCRVLITGDSLTDPRSGGGGYLKPWAARCPHCEFVNLGRGGAMVNQMLTATRQHFNQSHAQYSHVVVFGGVNDLYSDKTAHRTLEKIEHDLTAMYRLARAHAQFVIAITVAPWGGFHRWYTDERGQTTALLNQWIVGSRSRGDTDLVVDSGAVLTCGNTTVLCPSFVEPFKDGLHFGPLRSPKPRRIIASGPRRPGMWFAG